MICHLCPRQCGAERTARDGGGFCGMPAVPRVARAALHFWEEPPISGTQGSGAVFFSGCPLRCAYCQNHDISAAGFGRDVSIERLQEIYAALIRQGAHNINLVTPTHFTPWIRASLTPRLPVPVVYNCGGYESAETLRTLEGDVQIYLPDLKYSDGALAARLSAAPDYFPVAKAAIAEMYRQVGDYQTDSRGILQKGVIIRHMVLPGALDNTRGVLDWIAGAFRPGQVLVSLMSQYTPQPDAEGVLRRRVTAAEYRAAVSYMENCGIRDGFTQERTAAREEYTPPFDLTGV